VIETVTEQVMVRAEKRGADGQVIRAAQFQTKTAQRLVQDRETVWFRAPCAPDITVELIASLQRALKARGRFYSEITGVYDVETGAAVRKLQAERGLDSPVLAQETIRELGLAASGAP
jgi:peptidoglycan hydrolase-like protein with peptidoglycan-binding domain